jgi:hypothetical protein
MAFVTNRVVAEMTKLDCHTISGQIIKDSMFVLLYFSLCAIPAAMSSSLQERFTREGTEASPPTSCLKC